MTLPLNDSDKAARAAMVAIQRWREAGGRVSLESVRRANDKLIQRAREPRNERDAFAIAHERVEQQTADDLARGIRIAVAQEHQRAFADTAADAHFPSCSGGCDQGRKLCLTPRACRQDGRVPFFWTVILILAPWAVIAIGAYFIWWRN